VKGHDQLQAGELTAGPSARSVAIPFIIFTAIWGSTWIVIRGQLGTVPPQWSVTYRFIVAALAMAAVAKWKGDDLNIGRKGLLAAVFLGFTQFCINFNAVYLAERHITSGVVATVFALLLIPATLLGWAMLDRHRQIRRKMNFSRCQPFRALGHTDQNPLALPQFPNSEAAHHVHMAKNVGRAAIGNEPIAFRTREPLAHCKMGRTHRLPDQNLARTRSTL